MSPTTFSYTISPTFWVIQDAPNKKRQKQLAFHVASDDYFGTLASIISLLEGQIREIPVRQPQALKHRSALLQRLRDDLVYLQKHYRIEQK
ncbi:MAG: hypothetical protein RL141_1114 [Candidatus Parcubacteria bacterium]|jgi:hypothetical protein